MNLETKIDERLWNEIRSSYEDRKYSDAIRDSIFFLSDIIRNKSDLSSDGVSLVSSAFGGNNPKLKINKFQSESDFNEQKGLVHVLMGIYEMIRNPRSHSKIQDDEKIADSIILFIDYLIDLIDRSKSQFSENDYIERVFDPAFVENEKYAKLLVKEIPNKKRLDIFFLVYNEKESGMVTKLKYFFNELFNLFNNNETKQALEIISSELKKTRSDKTVKYILKILPVKLWKEIDEIARLRIENKIIDSIKDGKSFRNRDTSEGWLATWAIDYLNYFDLSEELDITIMSKLDSEERAQQDYIFTHFSDYLNSMLKNPDTWLIFIISSALQNGDKRFYTLIINKPDTIKKHFKKELKNFKEKKFEEDEIDFSDEDIPF